MIPPFDQAREGSCRILVTGANGFIGRALVARLLAEERCVVGAMRCPTDENWAVQSPSLDSASDWRPLLADKAVVIHAAARAHVFRDNLKAEVSVLHRVNVEGTVDLALQALRAGVRRFIYISSIGVNGNQTFGQPFSEGDTSDPQEPYAISKLDAEIALHTLFAGTHAQLVIVRPPLVYGPNAPGNFRRLLKLAASGMPLPLGAINNKRSFVAIDNLVDLIITCIDHPAAANQTFLASDGDDISTTQLLRRIRGAMGKPACLVPVPVWLLEALAALLGKRDLSQRLCGDLQVDISKARNLLAWSPSMSVAEGLKVAAEHYLAVSSK